MKKTVSTNDFIVSFSGQYENNFSDEGKIALYDYLIELEESIGEEFELDPIALCCEYAEYEDFEEFRSEYGEEYKSVADIREKTSMVCVGENGFIISIF